jgi:WD40 repeat protein
LNKPGFKTWSKTLTVTAGGVGLAQYVILTPNSPKTTVLDERQTILAQAMTKDHNHLVYVVGGDQAGVYVSDIGGGVKKVFAVPVPEKDKLPEILVSVSWSDDGSHLLVVTQAGAATATAGAAKVYRVMSVDGGDVVNLTDQYKFDFAGLTFSQNNWKRLYWAAGGDLRRVDLDAKAVSGVLADKVTQVFPSGDRLLYVRADITGYSLWNLDSSDKPQPVVAALTPSSSYDVALTSYNGQDELAVVPASTRVGLLYTGIFGSTPTTQTITQNVDRSSFSPDGHLLAFYSSDEIAVYDFEKSDFLKQRTTYLFPKVTALRQLTWFDNFHVVLNENGRIVWSEFDGDNARDLGAAYAEFPAYGSNDNRSVIGLFDYGVGRVRSEQLLLKP